MTAIRSKMALAVIVAAGIGMQAAQAQDRPMGPGGQGMGGQGMGGPGMGGPGMGGPGMGGPGGMRGHGMMGPRPVITATDKYVYVLRGDTLFQFSADGLKPTGRVELPRPEPRDRPDAKGAPQKK